MSLLKAIVSLRLALPGVAHHLDAGLRQRRRGGGEQEQAGGEQAGRRAARAARDGRGKRKKGRRQPPPDGGGGRLAHGLSLREGGTGAPAGHGRRGPWHQPRGRNAVGAEALGHGPALGSRLSALGSRLSALGSRLSALGSRLSALGSRLSALGSRLSALGSRLSALGSRLSALGSRLSALGSRLSRHYAPPSARRRGVVVGHRMRAHRGPIGAASTRHAHAFQHGGHAGPGVAEVHSLTLRGGERKVYGTLAGTGYPGTSPCKSSHMGGVRSPLECR